MVNEERYTDRSLGSVGCIEDGVGGRLVLRADPLALQHAPHGFRDVEVRRVRREIEEEESLAFPNRPQLLDGVTVVDAGVVKHDDGVSCPLPEGQPVEEVCRFFCDYAALRGEAPVSVVPGRHAEYVGAGCLPGWDVDILLLELPSVRHVTLDADVVPVVIEEVYPTVFRFLFKFLISRPCTRRVAARVFPLGVSLYAYILRQC